MKKNMVIGISIVSGIAIAGLAALGIALAANSGNNGDRESSSDDSYFQLTEQNYGIYYHDCKSDAIDAYPLAVGGDDGIKTPVKTGEKTQEGNPIWKIEWTWESDDEYTQRNTDTDEIEIVTEPPHTYVCRLATTKTGAYLIDLTIDGEKRKEYRKP